MCTLLQELRHNGAKSPALAMLVEPLLPRAWRKELEKQKLLKDDADTDLYAVNIAEQDIAQAFEEEGSPLGDDFVIPEGPEMAKLSLKVQKISDALDLVPVSKRDCVEHAVASVIGQGMDKLMECFQSFQNKYADSKYHEASGCMHSRKPSRQMTWLIRILRAIITGKSDVGQTIYCNKLKHMQFCFAWKACVINRNFTISTIFFQIQTAKFERLQGGAVLFRFGQCQTEISLYIKPVLYCNIGIHGLHVNASKLATCKFGFVRIPHMQSEIA